jgi:hypothetical protein
MQPERRRRYRIMTLKNFGRACLVALLVLAAANVISELRKPRHGEYGRLVAREEPRDVTPKYQPPVVQEGTVADETPIGDTVVLGGAPAAAPASVLPPPPITAGGGAVAPLKTGKVTIVGGADGVRVESTSTAATPKLSGGIFRQ